MDEEKKFSVIVVGAGHAGLEAAFAAEKMGKSCALISLSLSQAGEMPCNPSIGGIAKGHLVREIDALGGMMGIAVDETGIQFRMLNKSKGPAVWGPRAQADKEEYKKFFVKKIEGSGINFIKAEVTGIIIKSDRAVGVKLDDGTQIHGEKIIITTGTFLRGRLFTGLASTPGGRLGDPPSNELSLSIQRLGFNTARLKTGTPARIFKDSIDLSKTEEQKGDDEDYSFSFWSDKTIRNMISCHITFTSDKTHDIIRNGLKFSPLYSGMIDGVGPRYCPSIEDKVVKFSNRDSHQIFLEPEGINSDLVYPNGISTSLSPEVQEEFIHTIPGLERARVAKFGYAVEYDVVLPTQLKKTMETKEIPGLYFAGQVNGTSGYEEAAAQGLMAGINACLSIDGRDAFILNRDEAYIGVLLDDLVLKGVNEPYRLFTSQAEHRLMLRQDTAMLRLGRYGVELGLMDISQQERFEKYKVSIGAIRARFSERVLSDEKKRDYISIAKADPEEAIVEYLKMYDDKRRDVFTVTYDYKYSGYIEREVRRIASKAYLKTNIPKDIDYYGIEGLKIEAKEKLQRIRPENLEDAEKIPGVTAADIDVILINIKRK
ncbi:tRNA uridine-5-carboxymethylaminomethyl(34) synthesis enzyme MnmG [bacterium]|nr:tRNA uridine-5-carboxymethylaminomethyl(34) synthesis enzyme MnmG [bacterium]